MRHSVYIGRNWLSFAYLLIVKIKSQGDNAVICLTISEFSCDSGNRETIETMGDFILNLLVN